MVTLLSGLVGGLVATIAMTVVMMVAQNAMGRNEPTPTQLLWAKYVGGGDPGEHTGVVLHLVYGIVAGGVFVLFVTAVGLGLGTLTMAVVWGLVWGVVLFVVGAVFWMTLVLDVSPGMDRAVPFLVVHLVYGLVLGLWVVYVPSF